MARAFVVPAILVLFASGGSPYGMWGATGARIWATIALVFVAVMAILPYLIFRYTLADAEIVIRDGIFTRTERHIPYSRIQNIDLVQNPLHRAFDVALVRVETASGGKPEAVLRVLSLEAIEQMRARVFAGRTDAATGLVEAMAEEGATPAARSATRACCCCRRSRPRSWPSWESPPTRGWWWSAPPWACSGNGSGSSTG